MNICKAKLAGLLAALIVMGSMSGPALADTGTLVSIDWLAENLDKPNMVVLDVGAFFHYEKKHIPGAVKAFGPWQTVNEKHQGYMMPPSEDLVRMICSYGVNQDSLVVIYDEGVTTDDTAKSARALWTLHALGHERVAILDGGFSAWEQAEKPVTAAPVFPAAGNFAGRLVAAKLATLDEVKAKIRSKKVVLVDTRLPEEDFGHEKKSYIKLSGHLPGSRLWPASAMTNAGEEFSPSLMRDRKELEEMAMGVGIPADKDVEIITYSNRGMQAALGYYVLHDLLGYRNVKLFDGSMLVAAADESVPIESNSWGFITQR
jgi:thiosulfate/3-mercaptopyruvate sulfurtransferase